MKRIESGITVLELTVIILIIGAVAGITLPNIVTAARSYKLNMAATALAQQLNLCRQEAVKSNLPTTLRLTGNIAEVDVNHDDAFDSADGPVRTISSESNIVITTTTQQNSTLGTGKVQFSSRGDIPVGDSPPVFRITYSTRYRTVTVDTRGAVTVSAEQ
jgi:Tfp pilus assembly protein FimT